GASTSWRDWTIGDKEAGPGTRRRNERLPATAPRNSHM
ncbi:MAG: hypothetical protein AVDCRST_MAG02-636, partial [uncultured Rubrobacteraceae bacterium]